ncbi:hypothetical protein [Clostridium baratii]|uniref:hypothetical protein n=1 Tax=Clostridium baratii TaxID=1561 RepID=UPI0030CE8698
MKRIIGILLSILMVGALFVSCSSKEESDDKNTSQNENILEDSMLSQSEKDSYKTKVEKALEGENVSDIDILTQNKTKKPIVSLQVVFNGIKGKVNKRDIETLINKIEKKIEPISDLYDITILDKNNQMIAMSGYEDKGKIEFF